MEENRGISIAVDRVEREVEALFGKKIKEALLIELEERFPLSYEKPFVDIKELEKALTLILGPAGKVVIDKINKTSGK